MRLMAGYYAMGARLLVSGRLGLLAGMIGQSPA
jgi:hypothetical protein